MLNLQELLHEKEFVLLIATAFSGWIVSIIQFLINRYNQKKDKLSDRKYEAYSGYMKKFDEVMQSVRKNPSKMIALLNNFTANMLKNIGNQDIISAELIKVSQELSKFVISATEPLLILKNESNNLLLICSDELKQKIEELIKLTLDYNDEVQKTMSLISPNDLNSLAKNLQTLGQDARWKMFEKLKDEMIYTMRKEIGSNKY